MQSTDLRVVKTMKQIDHALLSCLSEEPFEKITVEQLCRAALINRSTFYKYYTSKYDLMERYLQRALHGFQRPVQRYQLVALGRGGREDALVNARITR